MKILVTGSAGFIGFHLCKVLLSRGFDVVGIDNLNSYYDTQLKKARLDELDKHCKAHDLDLAYTFRTLDISDSKSVDDLFKSESFDVVVNLAAQAGVRYSIQNPKAYIESNVVGFLNILEGCRNHSVKKLLYASSSSIYGMSKQTPFSIDDVTDSPISLYAATKKTNELMAFTYSHLYGLSTIGMRFFTVYGPWGRPDMAYYSFTSKIDKGETIDLYNNGEMERDFTYIDDLVFGVVALISHEPVEQDSPHSFAKSKSEIFNLGNSSPIKLNRFVSAIESALGKKAIINSLPMQPGDVKVTFADIKETTEEIGFMPETQIEEGIVNFVDWYMAYEQKSF